MDINKLKNILEAVLLASDKTLSVVQLENLFELDEERPTRDEIRQALHEMADDYETRGYELKQVASGFRLQVRQEFSTWVGRLWEERPARYTRALLETISLIAYRQPITRGEIEEVRGVSVSSNIIKTLLERDWVKVLGHKDVPGKPSLYGTTKEFLDYFNLKSLDQLPTLAEIKDLDSIHPELELDEEVADNAGDQTDDQNSDNNVESKNNPEASADDSASEDITSEDVVSEDVTSEDKPENAELVTEESEKAGSEENVAEDEASETDATEADAMEDNERAATSA